MTNKFKIRYDLDLPEGVKLSKKEIYVETSYNEYFPLTKMEVGGAFRVKGRTARSLRGVIHKKSRTKGMKFRAVTDQLPTGPRTTVWRIR
jgi:hypothetical protein